MSETDTPPPQPARKGFLGTLLAALLGGLVTGGGTIGVLMSGLVPLGGARTATPKPAEPVRFAPLSGNFTSNLAGSGRYIQVSLGISTRGGEPAIEAVRANEIAIRSAIVETLARQTDAVIAAPEGRQKLLVELRTAINAALAKSGASATVADVYFMSLVVQ